MKIGISPSGMARFGEERYTKLRSIGYDCVDYGLADTESGFYLLSGDALDAALQHERELAQSAGITFSQVHGPWRWPACDGSEDERAERLECMTCSIGMAAKLGCRNWVVHPIMPFGINDLGTEQAAQTWELNIEFMSKLLKVAREYDVVICLENMPMRHFSIATPQRINDFVQTINDPNFKMCLDTGHVAIIHGLSVGDEVRKYGKNIKAY